jgi:hypothetical protein
MSTKEGDCHTLLRRVRNDNILGEFISPSGGFARFRTYHAPQGSQWQYHKRDCFPRMLIDDRTEILQG